MTEKQINQFLDRAIMSSVTYKNVIKKRLIKWTTAYELHPSEDEIEYLINDILADHFGEEEAQHFLDLYFGRILIRDYKK